MKKVFGQTVRDLKRGVNKKVLKVHGIEQKVLDATNNDSWGPHGSLLAEIAQASKNYHEYQITMVVLWKRLSDTGKNWRHVFKALTVLEYMVGHGSERVIEEIKERVYQISTLSHFQYIDSSGKDQGNNIRKKSQSLVALVNDKERIAEVREKVAANGDKYGNSAGRPSGGYGDRDEGRSSYGGEKEYGYRDDDRNSRDGDRYSRNSEERYGREGSRDDEYHGRSKSVDNYQNGSRPSEDDGQSSSRADDHSQDGSRVGMERKFSEQNIGTAPPSYEEAVSESRSPVYSESNGGEIPQVAPLGVDVSLPVDSSDIDNKDDGFVDGSLPQQVESFDEFDPRGSVPDFASAPASGPSVSKNVEMDLLGSLSDVFSANPLAMVTSDSTSAVTNGQRTDGLASSFSTSQSSTQPFDDPFGDSPFKAITYPDTDPNQHQSFGAPFQQTPSPSNPENGNMFGFGESFSAVSNPQDSSIFPQEEFDTSEEAEIDILAGILPPTGPSVSLSQPNPTSQFSPQDGNMYENFHPQATPSDPNMSGQTPFGHPSQQYNMVSHSQNLPGGVQFNNGGFMQQQGYEVSENSQPPRYTSEPFPHQPGSATSSSSQSPFSATSNAPAGQFNGGNFMPQQSHVVTQQPHGVTQQPHGVTQQVHDIPFHIPQRTQSGPVATHGNNNGSYAVSEHSQPPQYTHGLSSHQTSEPFSHQPSSATSSGSQTPFSATSNALAGQFNNGNLMTHQLHGLAQQVHGVPSNIHRTQSGPVNNGTGDMFAQGGPVSLGTSVSQPSLTPMTGAIEVVPPQTQKKFEPKSSIWADTLSRGLVNFNISGPKTNPLSDIGVDFAAINRKEKRLEKPSATQQQQQVTSTINMGKAMGSGTGLGRAGAGVMRPPTNSMVGSTISMDMNQNHPMGMGMNQNHPMGMRMNQNYQLGMGMNQNHPMGMGMNMNQNHHMRMNMNQNHQMGMDMNMGGGYGQGYPMQQPQQGMGMTHGSQQGMGMAHGSQQGMTGFAYNPMMGQGGYNPQQQQSYGGGGYH